MTDPLSQLINTARDLSAAAATFYCCRELYGQPDPMVAWHLSKAKTLIAAAEEILNGCRECAHDEGDRANG